MRCTQTGTGLATKSHCWPARGRTPKSTEVALIILCAGEPLTTSVNFFDFLCSLAWALPFCGGAFEHRKGRALSHRYQSRRINRAPRIFFWLQRVSHPYAAVLCARASVASPTNPAHGHCSRWYRVEYRHGGGNKRNLRLNLPRKAIFRRCRQNEGDIELAQQLEKIRDQKTHVPSFYAITQGPIALYFQPGARL